MENNKTSPIIQFVIASLYFALSDAMEETANFIAINNTEIEKKETDK